ncbi:MAG TPA: formyltetrahydrofolate deformylase, partial [Nitratifractor sp.]|nr:formyltetrahydrofolate deformylase [Nitratifractor sp.]
ILMVTKESHALGDLLIRHVDGELEANIIAVIGNRENLRDLVERFDIPFICISAEGKSREEHEALVLEELAKYSFDYIVLAKYMRILTPSFVEHYPGKIINIHHSFLPAFIGANPYKQAYERGVKIIGATAHFVTNDLDEGPIIAQDVISVNHRFDWKDMQRAGRDVEKVVLSRALKLVLEDRVFVYNNKTVVF